MTTSLKAVALAAVFALLTSIPLNAGATYSEKGFYCVSNGLGTGGSLMIHWPSLTSVSGYPENVYFTAVIYRYDPATGNDTVWAYAPGTMVYNNAYTWYVGRANSLGNMAWAYNQGPFYWKLNGALVMNPAISLGPGYYRVGEFFRWQNGYTASTWATFTTNQGATTGGIPVGVKGGYCKL